MVVSPPSDFLTPPSSPPTAHTMQTRAKSGIFKPNPRYSFHTHDISPIPTNPKLALLDKNWKDVMLTEYNALLK